MNKKILCIFILFFISLTGIFAQCVPDLTITDSGIYPDSATNLSSGTVSISYTQVLQVRVPPDTTVGGITATINSIDLTSLTGLPPGLTYNCNPSGCSFPGGSNGCADISGTPTTAGTFHIRAITTTHYTIVIFPATRVDTLDYYFITINASTVGLQQNGSKKLFAVLQNTPNPFNDFTQINYSVPSKSPVELKVFNILGKEVLKEQLLAESGINSCKVDGRALMPGIYMYTINLAGELRSGRMVISRK